MNPVNQPAGRRGLKAVMTARKGGNTRMKRGVLVGGNNDILISHLYKWSIFYNYSRIINTSSVTVP